MMRDQPRSQKLHHDWSHIPGQLKWTHLDRGGDRETDLELFPALLGVLLGSLGRPVPPGPGRGGGGLARVGLQTWKYNQGLTV